MAHTVGRTAFAVRGSVLLTTTSQARQKEGRQDKLGFYVLSCAVDIMLFLALAVWRFKIGHKSARLALLITAFLTMAFWAGMLLVGAPVLVRLADAIRDLAWVVYIWAMINFDSTKKSGWNSAYTMLLAAAGLRVLLISVLPITGLSFLLDFDHVLSVYSLAFCVAALVLLNNLYFAATSLSSGFRLILICLALSWAYDLNLYTALVLNIPVGETIVYGRPSVALALAPMFGLAARRKERWAIGLSRQATFQTLALVAIGGYFVLVSLASRFFDLTSFGPNIDVRALAFTVAIGSILFVALSPRLRIWLKSAVTKSLFVHRYDYREEWLRFNATINGGRLTDLAPEQRAIKAVAEVMGCTKGRLLLASPSAELREVASYNWPADASMDGLELTSAGIQAITSQSTVIQFNSTGDKLILVPDTLKHLDDVWIGVPLIRVNVLIGIIVLNEPHLHRELDWEDLAILKVLGQQIATYLTDAQSERELEQARQFDEFNRRFAFIVHDIKNVVSQLTMVTVNAEIHGQNPKFQVSMMTTLRNSVDKMNTLLLRLSDHHDKGELSLESIDVAALLRDVVAGRQGQHPLESDFPPTLNAVGDRRDLQIALDHVLQNAIEASPHRTPVHIRLIDNERYAEIEITDYGLGMSAEFVRNQLFKPFSSTKLNGFGIGAGEARDLIERMKGRMTVRSVEGSGSSFFIRLEKNVVIEEERI